MLDAAKCSWLDIRDAVASRPVLAFLAVGAVEQHGAHLPLLTDTVMANGVARRLAEAEAGFLLPPLAFGECWTTESFPGTISISPQTLKALVLDIGRSLKRTGVAGLVLVNGHFGNREPIGLAARALFSEHGLPVLCLDYPGLVETAEEICDSKPAAPHFYHADEVETAFMLALAPETVRMELAAPEYPVFPATFGQEPIELSSFNESGVFGDPRPATAEKGEIFLARITEQSRRAIAAFRKNHGIAEREMTV
ncbi:creatininase family protein [Rhizobium alvei]|uniref:Creatininase family protein n=1 Tax=Rhizobium alvei TaxID=1132659 RepID=A0ABT8YRP3_9HYPH|nr:creatininase family protein [Rhizobium alvei]MDO6966403.1 creatininase family protein [Rhizobium alvei]